MEHTLAMSAEPPPTAQSPGQIYKHIQLRGPVFTSGLCLFLLYMGLPEIVANKQTFLKQAGVVVPTDMAPSTEGRRQGTHNKARPTGTHSPSCLLIDWDTRLPFPVAEPNSTPASHRISSCSARPSCDDAD